jgi:hypothetical protein
MAIDRKSRLKPGSIHPTLVDETSGLQVNPDTGILNATSLKNEINTFDQRFNNLPWKQVINVQEVFDDVDITDEATQVLELNHILVPGNTYYSRTDKAFYIYIKDVTNIDSAWQPTNWIAANRIEGFLKIPLTLDYADKEYVNTQVSQLVGVDQQTLQSIQDLLDYIANNPTANIIGRITALETNKANRSEIYTQDIIDNKLQTINTNIDLLSDSIMTPANYSCGNDPLDSDNNINDLYNNTKVRIVDDFTLNYLIKQGVEISETPLIIDQAPVLFTGLQPQKNYMFSRLNKVEINRNLSLQQGNSDQITFNNIWFAYGFEVKSTSAYVKLTFNNCLFENTSLAGGSVFSSLVEDANVNRIDLEFYNCTFNLTNNLLIKRANVSFDNCFFLDSANKDQINLYNNCDAKVINSHSESCINIYDNSLLELQGCSFKKTTGSESYLDIRNLDVNLSPSLVKLKDITFDTYETFTSDYISGTGELYLDYNIIEQNLRSALVDGTKIIVPRISSMLNAGSGIELNKFFQPYGSENFFYNDEFARDAIGAMITSSTHSSGIVWTYNDNNNKLSLSLETLSSIDLADTNNIAYKDEENVFSGTLNAFQNISTNIITNSATLSTGSVKSTTGNIDTLESANLTTTTQLSTDNSTKAATTAFVQERFSNLVAQFNSTELTELSDVTITSATLSSSQVLKYDSNTTQWINAQLDFDDLLDTDKVVTENDSVFKLGQIDPPTDQRDNGAIPETTRYLSTNQVLAWNGIDRIDEGTGDEDPNAKYIPVLINEIILYAQEANSQQGETVAGAGIITIASTEGVRDGTDLNKAVIPPYLYKHYLRRDASNIDPSETQSARDNLDIDSEFVKIDLSNATTAANYRSHIGLPALEAGKYLVGTASNWTNTDRTLGYLQPEGLDFTSSPSSKWDLSPSYFYNVKTPANETKYVVLPDINSMNPQGGTIRIKKENGSTHATAGTVSIRANDSDDVIITADNEVITSSGSNEAQIDILVAGHTVDLYVGYSIALNKRVWYAFGYYYNSADQTQPVPVIDLTQEATEDAIISLFNHNDHSPALSVNYDDPNHQVELNLAFASQAEVTAGTIDNLPIAPNTLKSITNDIDTSITDLETLASNTYLAKDSNLDDLQDVPTARTNLGLGTAATYNVGINSGELLLNGTLLPNKFTYFNGTNLVTNDLPIATSTINGLIQTTTITDVITTNALSDTKALTPYDLNEAITTNVGTSTIRDNILSLTNTLKYEYTNNATVNATVTKHYSLRADPNSIVVNLPDITTVATGARISIKLKRLVNNNTVTINPYSNQTIDDDTSSFVLDVVGQAITLVAGNDNNETDWEIV